MSQWETKAHEIIKVLCTESYRQANPKKRKRVNPYTVPLFAAELIKVLGWHDRTAAEYKAKQMFAAYHDGLVNGWETYAA
jgi:hypothetical protein